MCGYGKDELETLSPFCFKIRERWNDKSTRFVRPVLVRIRVTHFCSLASVSSFSLLFPNPSAAMASPAPFLPSFPPHWASPLGIYERERKRGPNFLLPPHLFRVAKEGRKEDPPTSFDGPNFPLIPNSFSKVKSQELIRRISPFGNRVIIKVPRLKKRDSLIRTFIYKRKKILPLGPRRRD